VRWPSSIDQGELPATSRQRALLLIAGALMAVPGFLTDIAGLLLLLPPQALVRLVLMRRFESGCAPRSRLRPVPCSAPFGGGFTTAGVHRRGSYGDGPASDASGPSRALVAPPGRRGRRRDPADGSGPAPHAAAGPAHGAGSADAAGPGSVPGSATDPERPTGRY
jgi:hypothetical protein